MKTTLIIICLIITLVVIALLSACLFLERKGKKKAKSTTPDPDPANDTPEEESSEGSQDQSETKPDPEPTPKPCDCPEKGAKDDAAAALKAAEEVKAENSKLREELEAQKAEAEANAKKISDLEKANTVGYQSAVDAAKAALRNLVRERDRLLNRVEYLSTSKKEVLEKNLAKIRDKFAKLLRAWEDAKTETAFASEELESLGRTAREQNGGSDAETVEAAGSASEAAKAKLKAAELYEDECRQAAFGNANGEIVGEDGKPTKAPAVLLDEAEASLEANAIEIEELNKKIDKLNEEIAELEAKIAKA